jgi:hypothetical protein
LELEWNNEKLEKVNRFGVAAVIMLFLISTLLIPNSESETQDIPAVENPTPGYFETSEYLIGSVTVGIILPESNGTIDPSTEDWTDEEIEKVLSKIQIALDWWASQNPNASVSFAVKTHLRVPTSYEPITQENGTLWREEVMTNLGFPPMKEEPPPGNPRFVFQILDYVNALRSNLETDWGFLIFVVDASNDEDGLFPGGWPASAFVGEITVPVKNTDNLDWIVAHEMGHIFQAMDEYYDMVLYNGYLNVPSIPHSGCIMETPGSWNLSGKPHGLNGTWGQIGWRDCDGDGIQDIVDTSQRVYFNSQKIRNYFNFTGVAAVTPYPNKNPSKWSLKIKRDVTTNKIRLVQYRIDKGTWQNASITLWKFKKLIRYPSTYEYKETHAVVNFTFLTPELSPGKHLIEIKATNQWGNEGYANVTVTIPETIHDIAITSINPYRTTLANASSTSINVTVQNKGDATETFNVTLFCNTIQIGTQTTTLQARQSIILNFKWTTPGVGNYTLTAIASQIPGETSIDDNTLAFSLIRVSIPGDINADKTVNILDVSIAARAFGKKLGDPKFDPNADVNEDGTLNILDVSAIAKEYGKTAP